MTDGSLDGTARPTHEWLESVRQEAAQATAELLAMAQLRPGQILVVGCSTSEVLGRRIGTAASAAVAAAILDPIWALCQAAGILLACQACEHLNRALVTTAPCAERYGLEEVTVVPVPTAGGAFAARAMHHLPMAVVVEGIRAHAGLDIGETLIGMHLRPVAVPVRLARRTVGLARLGAARTRPKLVGGERAVYRLEPQGE